MSMEIPNSFKLYQFFPDEMKSWREKVERRSSANIYTDLSGSLRFSNSIGYQSNYP